MHVTLSRSDNSALKFFSSSKSSSSSKVLSSSNSWINISAVGSKSWSSEDNEPTGGGGGGGLLTDFSTTIKWNTIEKCNIYAKKKAYQGWNSQRKPVQTE